LNDDIESSEDELFEYKSIVVDKGQQPLRVDRFLMDRLHQISRNKIQRIAKGGGLSVNDECVKSNYKVKADDTVVVSLPHEKEQIEILPENIPLDIVFEDDDVLVINKPAGLVVHPGYGNHTGTLVNALAFHFKNLPVREEPDRPGIVHRLDKGTTGLMVVAKSDIAMTNLAKQFFDRTSQRHYWALVWGEPDPLEGIIEGNIGRSLKDRKVMTVFQDGEFGKTAVTSYKTLEKLGYVSLIECKLETGRTHQIRAHFKWIGHPLFGDVEYGGNRIMKGTTFNKFKQFVDNNLKILPRQALHAKTLGFAHPVTGKWMQFDSELPEDMTQVIERWENYIKNRPQ
tara:strand:- start:263 stop:1288 length:1026 start_codon:yes stop_codon:yes gene_type:complete